MDDIVLIESKTLRKQFCTENNTCVLDRISQLIVLPGTAWATKKDVANFYCVGESTIDMIVNRNRDALVSDGYKVLSSKGLRHTLCACLKSKSRSIAIFPRRAVLRVGMLLRDSLVAKTLRTYLLDLESSLQNNQAY